MWASVPPRFGGRAVFSSYWIDYAIAFVQQIQLPSRRVPPNCTPCNAFLPPQLVGLAASLPCISRSTALVCLTQQAMPGRFQLREPNSGPTDVVSADLYCSGRKPAEIAALHGLHFTYSGLSVDWCCGSISTGAASQTLLRTELRLLGALLETEGEPVHTRALIRSTWPDATHEITPHHALRAYVQSLRHRLELLGVNGKLVTVPGVGYRFVP